MVNQINPKYPTCPHCNQTVGFRQRIQKCAYSGELVCTKCIIDERFSDSVVAKIPPEIREKFRFYNSLIYIVYTFMIYYLLVTTWWSFGGYNLLNLEMMFEQLGIVLARWIGFIILAVLSGKLPRLGNWMYAYWISKPVNHQKVDVAIEAYAKGEWVPSTKGYQLKQKFIAFIKTSKLKFLFWIGVIVNVSMVPLFFIVRFNANLAGTLISVITGVIYLSLFVINFLIILGASAFYCDKGPENKTQRYKVEIFSWLYYLLQPVVFLFLIFSDVIQLGYGDELEKVGIHNYTAAAGMMYWTISMTLYMIQIGIIIILCLILLRSIPNFEIAKGRVPKPIFKNIQVQSTYKLIKGFGIALLFFGLLACFGLSLEIFFADFAMAICVLSYILVILYSTLIFVLLKLVHRIPQHRYHYKRPYWIIVKISVIIVGINIVPMVFTQAWTNPSMDTQFNAVFGPNWQNRIDPAMQARMRQYQFSAFDAYFGFDIPSNALYNQVYMQDSPRYVEYGSNKTIIDNGSTVYNGNNYGLENISYNMIFDAYLPAGTGFNVTFNDSKPVEYPVLIFMHGIGMDRGSGNANYTTQYFANLGYAAFDMSYGFTGYADYPYTSGKEKGFDFPDTIHEIGQFTKFLDAHQQFFHANMSAVYFIGRSWGGWMSAECGYLYNNPFASGNFSSDMIVRGVVNYYPAYDIPDAGPSLIGDYFTLSGDNPAYYIRGFNNPADSNYNPEWIYYNLRTLIDVSAPGSLCPSVLIQGTNDYLVNPGWTRQFQAELQKNHDTVIAGYYPLGSHGFDAYQNSPYGQSVIYYLERFFALTH